MCGIFGLLFNRPLTAADIALGRAGTAALAHRGPDGDGEWMDADKGVFFGHRRLSIIDLGDGGSQPMHRDNSVLTYNGELYNYRALRTALAQEGVRCSSQSDTEVLLRALTQWGEGAFDRFDGMFALALWDGRHATLAVDPFGEKPLYYAATPDGVYFSSEIAPLANLLALKPHFDDEAWATYLSLGYIPAPKTAYPDIRRLEPASVMRVEGGALGLATRYWSPPWRNLDGSPPTGPVRPIPDSGVDALRDALLESLEGRLIADVPIALFLSAGVDSALVAALCRQGLGRTLNCLTVAFPDGDIVDECDAAAAIAAHLGLPHEVLDNRVDRQAAGIERV
ncbi:MAG: asparagine synthetase B, partial [Rhodospirillaceae bacterium]|nr:asparagine synthetase B [Rhodospirillaceae bacterium]